MKNLFEAPEITVQSFDVEDIIATSGGTNSGNTGEFDGEWVNIFG
jgi:hypothetical protein